MNTQQQHTRHIVTVLLGEIAILRADGMTDKDLIRGLLGVVRTVGEKGDVDKTWLVNMLQGAALLAMRDVA